MAAIPAAFRPADVVNVPVNLCNAKKGRVVILPSGGVLLTAEPGVLFSNAQCMTSLDGVTYTLSEFTRLSLKNGWDTLASSSRAASAAVIDGIVYLRGAIATAGTSTRLFTLPLNMRPPKDVYVTANLLGGAMGGLVISPNGDVDVRTPGSFSDAQLSTSLDGISFAVQTAGFFPLALRNGWTPAPFFTGTPAAIKIGGVVHLKGAIQSSGSNMAPFILSGAFRPNAEVYVTSNLNASNKGRLHFSPTGDVVVEGDPSTAAAFTSLDGISFVASSSSLSPVTLQNGWNQAQFGNRVAGAFESQGIVRLGGAISTAGTNVIPFVLPANMAPRTSGLYLSVDLCDNAKGWLFISTTGEVTVGAALGGSWASAQCFTSLEGVEFSLL